MFQIISEYDGSHFFANTYGSILSIKISGNMMSDFNIQKQIEKAFETSPLLANCSLIAEVNQGEAILTGYVDKYSKKELAKKIAKEVEGIRHVTDTLLVKLSEDEKNADEAIVADIAEKFVKNFGIAHKDVKVTVRDGYVWLDGRLNWN